MPRRTHPRPRAKHPRGETRYQRERYIRKRWRLGKRLYGDDFWLSRELSRPGPVEAEHERLRHALGQVGPMLFVHPEVARRLEGWARWPALWPFSLEPGRFARNPYTRCSCGVCTWEKRFEPRRAREKRAWHRRVEAELLDRGD